MKSFTINRNEKIQHLSPSKVRSFLKKNDFKVGGWAKNGRISGMSNFFGGNIEVKEKWLDSTTKTTKLEGGWKHVNTTTVAVEVRVWDNEVSVKELSSLFKSNGWIVSKEDSDSLVVDAHA